MQKRKYYHNSGKNLLQNFQIFLKAEQLKHKICNKKNALPKNQFSERFPKIQLNY